MTTPPPHGAGPHPAAVQSAPRSRRLGRVALIVSLVVLVAATVSAIVGRANGNPLAGSIYTFGDIGEAGQPDAFDVYYTSVVLPWTALTAAGVLLALWALIQGIVAVVRRRGRGSGTLAIAVVVVAAIVYAAGFEAARGVEIFLN
jgi:hypothetical protein